MCMNWADAVCFRFVLTALSGSSTDGAGEAALYLLSVLLYFTSSSLSSLSSLTSLSCKSIEQKLALELKSLKFLCLYLLHSSMRQRYRKIIWIQEYWCSGLCNNDRTDGACTNWIFVEKFPQKSFTVDRVPWITDYIQIIGYRAWTSCSHVQHLKIKPVICLHVHSVHVQHLDAVINSVLPKHSNYHMSLNL